VAEVAEVREAHPAVGEHPGDLRDVEALIRERVRSVAKEQRNDGATGNRKTGSEKNIRPPVGGAEDVH
jgi:hypothetical protein